MKTKNDRNGVAARRRVANGKRMVMLEESEFERLLHKADEWEPLLPEPAADGNYPASRWPARSSATAAAWASRKGTWLAAPASAQNP